MTAFSPPDGEGEVPGRAGGTPAAAEIAADWARIGRGSVLVLGDATLERRVGGEHHVATDAFRLGHEHAEAGGAGGLARRLAELGIATALVSVLGDDLAGAELTALVGEQQNVEPWLLVDAEKATITETSYVDASGRVQFRTVREDLHALNNKLRRRMLRIGNDAMAATALTVLCDRGHGTLDVEAATDILSAARQTGRRIVADVERIAGLQARYRGFDAYVCLAEAGRAGEEAREEQALALRQNVEVGAAVLLLPEGGCIVADREGAERVGADHPSDPAGGYTSFVAAFAGALAIGRTVRRAAAVGIHATRPGVLPGTTP